MTADQQTGAYVLPPDLSKAYIHVQDEANYREGMAVFAFSNPPGTCFRCHRAIFWSLQALECGVSRLLAYHFARNARHF